MKMPLNSYDENKMSLVPRAVTTKTSDTASRIDDDDYEIDEIAYFTVR